MVTIEDIEKAIIGFNTVGDLVKVEFKDRILDVCLKDMEGLVVNKSTLAEVIHKKYMSDINETLNNDNDTSKNQTPVANDKRSNSIGNTIQLIGWITLIGGILIGLILGATLTTPDVTSYGTLTTNPNPLRWVYGVGIMISSFVSGVLFIGFGEVIMLLNDIKNNTSK